MHSEPEVFLTFSLIESLHNKFNNPFMADICCGLSKFQVSVSEDEISRLLLPDCDHFSFSTRYIAFFHFYDVSRILELFGVDKKEGLRELGIYALIQGHHPRIQGNTAPAGG